MKHTVAWWNISTEVAIYCYWRCIHTISALFTAIKGISPLQHYFHAD